MKFDLNRLSKLAGLDGNSQSSNLLSEASNRSLHDDPSLSDEAQYRFGSNQLNETDETDETDEGDREDEVLEIDEADLVAELRRLRTLSESRKRRARKQALQEAQLKAIIDKEVKSVLEEMEDLNITGNWVYGKNKPRRSRRGYVATSFPGIGFK